jgi:hypothetical protein
MKDTPETYEAVERWNQGKINIFDEMARLERERDEALRQRNETNDSSVYSCNFYYEEKLAAERERDDYMERCRTALSERDSWRMRADQKYAMRRELEELLGVDRNDASDEQFQKGLDAIKNIIGERDEARKHLKEIEEYGTEEINVAVDLRQRLATALVERNEARKVLLEIANASHFDNIGNWARNKAKEALEEAK